MSKHIKQFIPFGYTTFNLNNPPGNKFMLGLDEKSRKLYLYNRGKLYDISQQFADDLLDKDGKIKINYIPSGLADTVWFQQAIDKKVSSVFVFKGVLEYESDLEGIIKPEVGDLYLCKHSNGEQDQPREFAYNSNHEWQDVGSAFRLEKIYDDLFDLKDNIDELYIQLNTVSGVLTSMQIEIDTLSASINPAIDEKITIYDNTIESYSNMNELINNIKNI